MDDCCRKSVDLFAPANKYSSLLFTTWSIFYKDTRLVLNQILGDFFDNYTKNSKKDAL